MEWHRRRLGHCGAGAMIYPGCRITFPLHISIGDGTAIAPQCSSVESAHTREDVEAASPD